MLPLIDIKKINGPLRSQLNEVFRRYKQKNDFILGKELELFEKEFAHYRGSRHDIGVDSGVSALELTLRAMGIGPGDEVITSALSFIASAAAILRIKLKKLNHWNKLRRQTASFYINQLNAKSVKSLIAKSQCQYVHHMFVIRPKQRSSIQKRLLISGLQTAIYYTKALHQLKPFRKYAHEKKFSVSESLTRKILCLPLFPGIQKRDIKRVCDAISN